MPESSSSAMKFEKLPLSNDSIKPPCLEGFSFYSDGKNLTVFGGVSYDGKESDQLFSFSVKEKCKFNS